MNIEELKAYFKALKKNFESDNQDLRKSRNDEEVGISYNNGCINMIELVLIKLEEVK